MCKTRLFVTKNSNQKTFWIWDLICIQIVSRSQRKQTNNQFLALSLKFTIMSTLHLNINYYFCCESHLYDNDEWEGTADKLHFV